MIPPHLSMMGEEFCCCDSSSESECGYLEFQSKRCMSFTKASILGVVLKDSMRVTEERCHLIIFLRILKKF